jgi:ABC-type multidrug transport system fused ATPase/permease subunit
VAGAIRDGVRNTKKRGNETFPRNLWHLHGRLRPQGPEFAALGVGIVASGLGHGALALAAGFLARAFTHSGENASRWTLLEITYIGLGAALVKAGGSVILAYFESSIAQRTTATVRDHVAEKLMEAGHLGSRPRLLALVQVRLRELEGAMAHGVIAGGRALAQLAPIALGLIFVSPSLALVGGVALVPFGIGLAVLRRRWKARNQRVQRVSEEIQTSVDELVENLDLWRVHAAGDRVRGEIARQSEEARRLSSRVEAERAALSGMNEVLAALVLVGAVALAARLGFPLGDGTLVAFAAMFFMAYRPLRDLGDARSWYARGSTALDDLGAVLDQARSAPALPVESRVTGAPGELVAIGVGARERGPRTSFRVGKLESVAVVGENGSGKTTLLRVLMGLEPGVGAITWNGEAVESRGVGPSERPFAWAAQQAPLVTGTVLDNVVLSSGDETRARHALEELGASDLATLPDRVGPGGRALSGGERRLVAIARALASDAPLLLLDEPTGDLSGANRERVVAALERLKGRRAFVVVTHDLDLASLCDRAISLGSAPAALAAE